MAYSSSNASPRPEISAFLEESGEAEKGLVARQVLPVVDQPTRNGEYPRIRRGKGELMKINSTKRAMDGSYNEGIRAIEWDDYSCQEYGWEERIDDARKKEMDRFFDMEVLTAKLNKRTLLLDYEKRVADLFSNPSAMGVTPTPATYAYTEANLANIDFPKDVQGAQERLEKKGIRANSMIMTRAVFNFLRRSNKLQGFLFSNLGQGVYKLITEQDLVKPFDIQHIIIASGAYDSAPKDVDGTFTGTYIWSNAYVWLADVQGGDFANGGAGRTITWSADCPGGLFTTETYRNENRRGDMVRTRTHTDEKIVDSGSVEMIETNFA
jgi:hypothetical protein